MISILLFSFILMGILPFFGNATSGAKGRIYRYGIISNYDFTYHRYQGETGIGQGWRNSNGHYSWSSLTYTAADTSANDQSGNVYATLTQTSTSNSWLKKIWVTTSFTGLGDASDTGSEQGGIFDSHSFQKWRYS